MEVISVAEMTPRLTELLGRTVGGETFEITRDGQPVGRLTPPEPACDRAAAAAAVRQLKQMRGSLSGTAAAELRGLAHEGHRY